MNEDDKHGFAFRLPFVSGTFTGKRTAEFIAILCLLLLGVGGYVLWDHTRDTDRFADQYVSAMKLISNAIDDNAIAQREFACLISKKEDERRDAFRLGECRAYAEIGTSRRRSN